MPKSVFGTERKPCNFRIRPRNQGGHSLLIWSSRQCAVYVGFIDTACNSFIRFNYCGPVNFYRSKRFDNVFDVSTPPIQRLLALG